MFCFSGVVAGSLTTIALALVAGFFENVLSHWGFTLTEAIALFALMMAFLILFAFYGRGPKKQIPVPFFSLRPRQKMRPQPVRVTFCPNRPKKDMVSFNHHFCGSGRVLLGHFTLTRKFSSCVQQDPLIRRKGGLLREKAAELKFARKLVKSEACLSLKSEKKLVKLEARLEKKFLIKLANREAKWAKKLAILESRLEVKWRAKVARTIERIEAKCAKKVARVEAKWSKKVDRLQAKIDAVAARKAARRAKRAARKAAKIANAVDPVASTPTPLDPDPTAFFLPPIAAFPPHAPTTISLPPFAGLPLHGTGTADQDRAYAVAKERVGTDASVAKVIAAFVEKVKAKEQEQEAVALDEARAAEAAEVRSADIERDEVRAAKAAERLPPAAASLMPEMPSSLTWTEQANLIRRAKEEATKERKFQEAGEELRKMADSLGWTPSSYSVAATSVAPSQEFTEDEARAEEQEADAPAEAVANADTWEDGWEPCEACQSWLNHNFSSDESLDRYMDKALASPGFKPCRACGSWVGYFCGDEERLSQYQVDLTLKLELKFLETESWTKEQELKKELDRFKIIEPTISDRHRYLDDQTIARTPSPSRDTHKPP